MLKVMIVDNESAIRKGLVHCIHWGDLGCEIAAQADDGMMALEQIPIIQPNIVISDIRMPGMDGLELAEIIARDHPGIKVIILTGYPDFAYAQRAIQYHVVDFVLKPMTVENLTNAIEKAKAAIAEDRSSQDLQEKLSTTSARNIELQQSMLLHDLIHRVACSQLYVLNRLAQLKMDLRSYFVLKLHITSLSEEALTEEEYSEYLNQSQEILSDCLSSYQHYYIARGTQDCFVVICAAGEAPITALCREAVNIVGSLAHFLLFIGISNCNDNPICLADAADEAAQAVRFTVFTPDHPVTHFAELSSFPQQLTDEIFEMLSALKSAMELRNPADTEQLLDCIFAYADSNKLPPDTTSSAWSCSFPEWPDIRSRAAAFPRSSALWRPTPSPRWNPAPAHSCSKRRTWRRAAPPAQTISFPRYRPISAHTTVSSFRSTSLPSSSISAQATSRACLSARPAQR